MENKKKLGESEDDSDDDLCILIFGSLLTSDKVVSFNSLSNIQSILNVLGFFFNNKILMCSKMC